MFRKVIIVLLAILLGLSLTSLMAQEKVTLSSVDDQAEETSNIQKPVKVDQIRQVKLSKAIKIHRVRNKAIKQIYLGRDKNAAGYRNNQQIEPNRTQKVYQKTQQEGQKKLNSKSTKQNKKLQKAESSKAKSSNNSN